MSSNPIAKIAEMAHSVGAWLWVDAVHYAPHGPIDVQALGCDFLVCSAYKFFGPHGGGRGGGVGAGIFTPWQLRNGLV